MVLIELGLGWINQINQSINFIYTRSKTQQADFQACRVKKRKKERNLRILIDYKIITTITVI